MNHKVIKHIISIFLILTISFVVYANSLKNGFVNYDDDGLVLENKKIKGLNLKNIYSIFSEATGPDYLPLKELSYMIDYHFWKLNPFGFHLTNIILFMINCLFIYLLTFKIFENMMLSFFSCLFFALHPIHAEAVNWVSARKDVLSGVFFFLSILFYILSTSSKRLYYISSIISFILALFSKPSVIILPFLLPLYDYCFLTEKRVVRIEGTIIRAIPFFVIAAISTAITLSVASEKEVVKTYWGDSGYLTLLAMLGVLFDYIKLLFFPINLSVRYGVDFPPPSFKIISGAAILIVLLFILVKFRKSNRLIVFCILWFFITLIPVSNIIPIAILKADRYLYLPSFAFALGLGFFIFHQISSNNREGRDKTSPCKQNQIAVQCRDNLYGCPRTGTSPVPTNPPYPPFAKGGDSLSPPLKKGDGWGFLSSFYKYLVCILFFLISLSYFVLTFNQNTAWEDSLTLWLDTIKKSPGDSVAHNCLGTSYMDKGELEKGMFHFREAIKINPSYSDPHLNLGSLYSKKKQYSEALRETKIALDINPNNPKVYINLGNIYRQIGFSDKAMEAYKKAMEIDKKSGDSHYNLALLFSDKGLLDDAVKEYKKAISIDPTLAKAYNNLGNIYFKKGLIKEAIKEYKMAVQHDSNLFEAYNNLGGALSEIGRDEEAIKFLKIAIGLKKERFIPHFNLGKIYMDEKMFADATREFEKVLKLKPDYYQAHTNLGLIFLNLGDKEKAIEHFNATLKINPKDQIAIEFLKKLNF